MPASSETNIIPPLAGLGVAAAATILSFFGVGLLLIEQPGGAVRSSASPVSFAATLAKRPGAPVAIAPETLKSHVLDGIDTPPRHNLAVPKPALPKRNTAVGISISSLLAPTALAAPIPLRGSPPAQAKFGPTVDKPPAAPSFRGSPNPPTDRKPNVASAIAGTVSEAQAASSASRQGTTSIDRGMSSAPSNEDIKSFLGLGDAKLRTGDPISARLFYRWVYEAGESRGALGMAASYDPLILQRFHIPAQQSNITEAFEWYIRARELAVGPLKN